MAAPVVPLPLTTRRNFLGIQELMVAGRRQPTSQKRRFLYEVKVNIYRENQIIPLKTAKTEKHMYAVFSPS